MRTSTVVRAVRQKAGLTQQALAERARTTQSAIAAYESGSKEPSAATMTRIAMAAGLVVAWGLRPSSSATARTVQEIGSGDVDQHEALRLVADLATALTLMDEDDLRAEIAEDPGSCGDARWDALIGGVIERAAHQTGVRVPAWTSATSRFLTSWWFVSPYRSLHASALVDSPPELANRGVFLHEASLVSV